tara:strand:+ start:2797 stop:2946 length:150 start_codon:yes stop_codon:yes gene_type:complete
MSQSGRDGSQESSNQNLPQQQEQQQTTLDSKLNPSDIEKLYLKIKEDWL